mmetsp:Transcript_21450/g.59625  ORF Transcript_21450/g.59625 Transcript_21450/m.59625 type:complete len:342 (+) Transcript_21450:68-1093(+)
MALQEMTILGGTNSSSANSREKRDRRKYYLPIIRSLVRAVVFSNMLSVLDDLRLRRIFVPIFFVLVFFQNVFLAAAAGRSRAFRIAGDAFFPIVVDAAVTVVTPDAVREPVKEPATAPATATGPAHTPTAVANPVHGGANVVHVVFLVVIVVLVDELDDVDGAEFLGDPHDDAGDQHQADQSRKDVRGVPDGQDRLVAVELLQRVTGVVQLDGDRDVCPDNDQGNDEIRTRRLSRQKKGPRRQEDSQRDNVGRQLGSGAVREAVPKGHGELHDRADQQPPTVQIKREPKQPVLEQRFAPLPRDSRRRREESHHRHDSSPSAVNGGGAETIVVLTGQQKHQT